MGKTSKTSKTNTTSRTKMKPDLVMVLWSYGLNGLKKTKAGVSPAGAVDREFREVSGERYRH